MSNELLDTIWNQYDSITSSTNNVSVTTNKNVSIEACKNCTSTNLFNENSNLTCGECGLVQSTDYTFHNSIPYESAIPFRKTIGNSKLKKMQDWFMWTNEEKNVYKLTNYTKSLCSQLQLQEALVSPVIDTVNHVMNVIKQYDGTKRARVKDGIILVCIEYIGKMANIPLSGVELGKQLGLEIKYVTKAEKLVMELVNAKKLVLNRDIIVSNQSPFHYVETVINQRSLVVDPSILEKVKKVIEFCEKNDILLDHTPLSIGVCCFYYILREYNINLDIKMFSELYNLSVVTIMKTTNKIKQYSSVFKL